jgi:methyl-accepting chemotaxis protein
VGRPSTREIRAVLDEVAKAVQVIALSSSELRRTLGDSAQIAVDLEGAAHRAVKALQRLQPKGKR